MKEKRVRFTACQVHDNSNLFFLLTTSWNRIHRKIRRLLYVSCLRLSLYKILRYTSTLLCVSLIIIITLIKSLVSPRIPSSQSTRLYPHEPITINLSPFSVCHPQEFDVVNITYHYHRAHPDKSKQVCFLVENIDGGQWWSYVTQEFAEMLTYLRDMGHKSGINYRPFPRQNRIDFQTNLTKLFLKACEMDENLPLENQVTIVALLWDINRRIWQHLQTKVEELLQKTRIRVVSFIDDLHFTVKGQWISRSYVFNSISSEILSTYPYIFHNYYNNISTTKLTWLPHAASPLSFDTINASAENSLFVSGADLSEWYPCRSRAFALCEERQDLVSCLHHPGYGKTMKNDSTYYYGGQRYFSYMRKYVFGLATCQSVQYAIAKLFEIPANGLVLVTTNDLVPILRSLHLNVNEHFLTIDCSSSKTLTNELIRIRNISKEDIDSMRKKSQRIIHERHLTIHRATLIHIRLLAQALIASTSSAMERATWNQWGRNC